MFKKITILLLILTMFLTGCTSQHTGDDSTNETIPTDTEITTNNDETIVDDTNHDNVYEQPHIQILDETEEKITEEFECEGIGKIKYIHSTTSSKESLFSGEVAIGDTLCIGDFQYVFMKRFNGSQYENYDVLGFSVKALTEKEEYDNMMSILFNGVVLNADYCFANNKKITNVPFLSETIISANHCFDSCTNLISNEETSISVNLPKLTEATYMFANCAKIETVYINECKVTDTTGMFYNCDNLLKFTEIPNTVTNASKMFENCTKLSGTIIIPSPIKNYVDIFKGTKQDITIQGEMIDILTKEYKNIKGE